MKGKTMEFKDELKEARKNSGYTQQTLSEAFEVPKRTIESWETGTRTPPAYVQKLVLAWIKEHPFFMC